MSLSNGESTDIVQSTPGLHHVTAVASDPRRNVAFYTRVLGLRLVKQTVNLDAPSALHLYYGDAAGQPGTIISFFVWPTPSPGRAGTGQATAVRFAVAEHDLPHWTAHLDRHGVAAAEQTDEYGRRLLACEDPDGLPVHLVGLPGYAGDRTRAGAPRSDRATLSLHSVVLTVDDHRPTSALLSGVLGLAAGDAHPGGRSFSAPGVGPGRTVCVVEDGSRPAGIMGAGCVHHIAFRTANVLDQPHWQRRLRADGLDVTEIKDRRYFHSIYFTEPGGVRFEIATDPPGFAVDEGEDNLGRRMQLPPALESQRADFEARLG